MHVPETEIVIPNANSFYVGQMVRRLSAALEGDDPFIQVEIADVFMGTEAKLIDKRTGEVIHLLVFGASIPFVHEQLQMEEAS